MHGPDLHSAVTGSRRQTQEVREDEREEATKMTSVRSSSFFDRVEINHVRRT